MNLFDSLSLLLIMISLAAMPSSSVALVVTRSATQGFRHGVAVSIGIVLGDLVFVLLAILGLSAMAESMGALFVIVRYLGGAYLLWLGYSLLTAESRPAQAAPASPSSAHLIVSVGSGFLLTLGDVKAIFFYVSLFPTFIDLTAVSAVDVLTIAVVTIVAVGGVKIAYAAAARRIASATQGMGLQHGMRKLAGGFMVGVGGYLIVKA